jgi:uncharacterized protein
MMKLDDHQTIHLYGTPGQKRFNFMWEILVENALGIVILVDSADQDPLANLAFFLTSFKAFIKNKAIVVGLTRTDLPGKHQLEDYHRLLKENGLNPPVFEIDARKAKEVSMLVQALLISVDQSIEETLEVTE